MSYQLSKKRKFVRDGVFNAELIEFLKRELSSAGFAGVSHRVVAKNTEITIKSTSPKDVMGEKGQRIREVTSCIQKRFKYPEGSVKVYVERVIARSLSAMAQAESLRTKLLTAVPVRRAAMNIIRYSMENGAKGCEVIVGGKIKGQRAKSMKFRDGYMIKSGTSHKKFVDMCIRHCHLRAGTIGVQVKIMLPQDETGVRGPAENLPDVITVLDAKEHPMPVSQQ